MKKNPIGRTNVMVTSLGFGGAPIGNLYRATSDDDAALEPSTVQVTVSYTLIDTQTSEQTTVTLL